MMRGSGFVLAAAFSAVMLAPAAGSAQRYKPLPAFIVLAPTGAPVASTDIDPQERWLLVYVNPECGPCASLLKSLARWSSPQLVARTVLVVGGPADKAGAWIEAQLRGDLSGTRYFLDPEGSASGALGVDAAPELVGVRAGQIGWRLTGVLNDPRALQSVVRTWVEGATDR